MISLEPFFAFIDVFGEILHEGYRPKRLVRNRLAAKGLRVRIVRKRRDTHTKLKAPTAKFPMRALRIVVKLAHAKAYEMTARSAFDGVKYTNAFYIILAAQTRVWPRRVVMLVCGIVDFF